MMAGMETIESKEHAGFDGRVHRHDLRSDGSRWQVECWMRPLDHEGTPAEEFEHFWTSGGARDVENQWVPFEEASARAEFERQVSQVSQHHHP